VQLRWRLLLILFYNRTLAFTRKHYLRRLKLVSSSGGDAHAFLELSSAIVPSQLNNDK
jgi:hypothetical protein